MQLFPPSADDLRELDADSAVHRLTPLSDEAIAELLHELGPGRAVAILDRFGPDRRRQIALVAGHGEGDQWLAGHNWRQGTVGRLMEPPSAEFSEDATVVEVIDTLGAGDVLHGAAAALLAGGAGIVAALTEGVHRASESVRWPGALGWVRAAGGRA